MARQNFIGLVVSQGKMDKTVKVQIEKKVFNQVINKEILKRKNYLVHDEGNIAREGDIVRIEACRPISSRKHFAIAEIRKNEGSQFAKYDQIAKQQVIAEENEKTKEFLDRRSKTELEIAEGTSLFNELTFIYSNGFKSEEELTDDVKLKIADLKEKYGIKDWPPRNSEELKLDLQFLKEKIESLKLVIDFVTPTLEILLKDEYKERVDKVIAGISKKEPQDLKQNIRKNILRKYLLKNSDVAKVEFHDVFEIVQQQQQQQQ